MEDIKLTFHEDALEAASPRRPLNRKTGARGLRSIMETILLDTMYELPAMEGVEQVVISDEVVNGSAARSTYMHLSRFCRCATLSYFRT
jgi:ATP-dependent Clp protease ATP-binding subunit ClpX